MDNNNPSTNPRPTSSINGLDRNGVPFPPSNIAANPRFAAAEPSFGAAFPRHNPAHPLPPNSRGDFAGDLQPPDSDPLRVPGRGRPAAGNQMGPNHPMFGGSGAGDYNPNDDYRSGFGMRPRFDPVGPPGGPQQVYPPGRGSGGVNPSRGSGNNGNGEPNPDHLSPPDSLGNNMFY